jgi:hypothetical protein
LIAHDSGALAGCQAQNNLSVPALDLGTHPRNLPNGCAKLGDRLSTHSVL